MRAGWREVIAPQQSPIGTKGVAWVGAKGSMCNGCEAISDNFKVPRAREGRKL